MIPEYREWPVEMTPAEFLEKLNYSLASSMNGRFYTWEEVKKHAEDAKKLGIKTIEEYREWKYQKNFSMPEEDDNTTEEN